MLKQHKMMKHYTMFALATFGLLLLAGCPPAKPAGGQGASGQPPASAASAVKPGTSFALPLEVAADDEALANLDLSDPRLFALARCIALPLVRSLSDGSTAPGLASNWEGNPAGTEWTFNLNTAPGHDGEPDYLGRLLETHLKMILNGQDTPMRAQLMDLLQGAAEYHKGAAAEISGLKLDSGTLTLALTRPDHDLLAWVSQPGLAVLENWDVEQAAGYGPWKVASFAPASADQSTPAQIVLAPNPASLAGQPAAAQLAFLLVPDRQQQVELFKAGRLQAANVAWDAAPDVQGDSALAPAFKRLETAVPVVGQFDLHEFPWGESKFQSKRGLRQAVNWALDRDYLAETVNRQLTAWPYFFPKPLADYDPPQLLQQPTYALGQDIADAQQGLANADHMDGCHLIPGMDLGYLSTSDTETEVVEVLKYWNEITVKMRPFAMTPAELRLRLDQGTHEIVYRRLYPAYPSPDALAYPYLYGTLLGNGGNYWNQAQPEIDQFIRAAQAATAASDKTRSYRELAGKLDREALLVLIGYYTPAVLISPDLGGYTLSPYDFSASLPLQDFTKLGLVK
jgi:ABC-type transport system substrate-binding protein